MTHPYFISRALQFMKEAGARDLTISDITAIAEWAEAAKHQVQDAEARGASREEIYRLTHRGLIIARDGSVVGHTELFSCCGGDLSQYELSCESAVALGFETTKGLVRRISVRPGDLRLIGQKVGQQVIHGTYSELTSGRAPRIEVEQ